MTQGELRDGEYYFCRTDKYKCAMKWSLVGGYFTHGDVRFRFAEVRVLGVLWDWRDPPRDETSAEKRFRQAAARSEIEVVAYRGWRKDLDTAKVRIKHLEDTLTKIRNTLQNEGTLECK